MGETFDPGCICVYPTIAVPDLVKTVEYYQHQLGFELQFLWGEPPVHGGVTFGNATLHFNEQDRTWPRLPQDFGCIFELKT